MSGWLTKQARKADRLPRFRAPQRHRGYTLVEMLVVIFLMSTVMPLAAVAIHRMWRMEQQGRRSSEEQLQVARVAQLFRRDSHAAQRGDVSEGTLRLEIDDGSRIEYRPRSGALDRVVVRDGKTVHRDTFRLSHDTQVALTIREVHDLRCAQLTLPPHGTRSTAIVVEGLVGLHRGESP